MIATDLPGVRADAILGYLKAVGILRLVAEQADSNARGAWNGSVFRLHASLTRPEIEAFFVERYRPSPVFNPWNNGAGFDPKSRTQTAGKTLDAVTATNGARWERPRAVLAAARRVIDAVTAEIDDAKSQKVAILRRLRECYPDDALPWLDAAVVVGRDDPDYPRLLGTGGNDGRLDFSINFLQRALDVIGPNPVVGREDLLRDALHGTSEGKLSVDVAIGQYAPANAGGVNATTGFDAVSLVNPWDFVLLIEGAIVFAGSMSKRFGPAPPRAPARAAFPFTFRATTGGYASATADEDVRGEVWLPRWRGAATYRSVATMIRTARVDVDTTVEDAHPTARAALSAIEAAQAVIARGTSAGIEGFDRVVIAQRNGLAYAATRVGYVAAQVHDASASAADLARETRDWVERVRRNTDHLGAGARAALRAYDEAVFAFTGVAGTYDERRALQTWVATLGALDVAIGTAPPEGLTPFRFRDTATAAASRIAHALDDGSDEHALAAGWSSIGRDGVSPMRVDAAPVAFNDNGRLVYARRARREQTFVAMVANACVRRIRTAHDDEDRTPLDGSTTSGVALRPIARFIDGDPALRLGRIERLTLGYVLLPPVRVDPSLRAASDDDDEEPSVAWCALRLLIGGFASASNAPPRTRLPLDPEVPALLRAGRVRDALARAYRNAQIVASEVNMLQERRLRDIRYADLPNPLGACAALLLPLTVDARGRVRDRALEPRSFS